ncbi:MAG: cupredoxin domain-containing protein [Chloroflexota bacterium]|nr:cupredoxin domain-containing protein [Chloroflexota bacterium]
MTPTARPSLAAPSGDVTAVVIRENSFGPPEITVAVGVVTFVNGDDEVHTVTEGEDGAAAPNGRFDIFIDIGETAAVEFADPGDYLITCQFHGEMRLLVHAH